MAGKTYSAGTIFLQVVPVFKDVMDDIRRNAKDWDKALGDDMERSGREAGKRAGKALSDELGKAARDVDMPKIEPEVDTKRAEREMGSFERKVREQSKRAARALGENMNPEIRRIKAGLLEVANTKVNPGAEFDDTQALAKIRALLMELQRIDHRTVSVGTEADIAGAVTSLGILDRAAGRIDGRNVTLDVDARGAARATAELGAFNSLLSLFGGRARSASADGQEVANSFRAFNGVILASVTLLPALVPALAAVGGGLIALLPILGAVTAGIGAMVIGFSGIGDAVSALGDVQDSAAKDSLAASKTMSAAANSVADAQLALARAEQQAAWSRADAARAVARAREAAADAIEEALKRQKDAQEDYRDSVRDVQEAEHNLAEARKQAAKDQADLEDQLRQNKVDERQAVLDLFNAQSEFNATMSDGSATNTDREQASINLEQAQIRLNEIRQAQQELAAEQAKAQKQGLNGDERVHDAKNALVEALERQKDAEEALGEASKAVDKARIDGARAVQDALRNQSRTAITSAQSIADAQRSLQRAQEGYSDAVQQTGDLGSASMQKLETAMGKLSPAGRRFAHFLFSLRADFYKLRASIQEAMLPPLQRAITRFLHTYGPQMSRFLTGMGATVGGLFVDLEKSLEGPTWRKFFGMMARFGPKLLRQFGRTTINWLEIFGRLMVIAAPAALAMSKAMLRMSRAILDWIKGKKGTDTITRFLEYAQRVGPKVVDFFAALGGAVITLLEALAPWGELVMSALTAFLDFIAGMDPKTLMLIISTIFVLVTAFQLAAGAIAAAGAGVALLGSTLGVWVLAIVLIVGLLAVLYVRFEKVRKVVDTIFAFITDHWKGILQIFLAWVALPVALYWKFEWFRRLVNKIFEGLVWYFLNVVVPVWSYLFKVIAAAFVAIQGAWQAYLLPVLRHIGKIIVWLAKNIVAPYFRFIWNVIKTAFTVIKTLWTHILWPILDLIGTVIVKLWLHYWRPKVKAMGDFWHDFATGVKYVWDTYGQPIFDYIKDKALPKLQKAWEDTVGAIGTAWGLLKKYIAEPLVGLFDLVVNQGLIDGFNVIARFVGSDEMKHINLPFDASGTAVKKAQGGVLPGWTPGRDVHHFFSPTGGRLDLSGGEAVMRPEFTAAVGKGWIDQMNMAARTGGSRGVAKMLAAGAGHYFSRGGIVPEQAFAAGGVLKNPDAPVTVNGKKIAAVFAAQMGLAAKLFGLNWTLIQGGFGGNPGNESYSGSSHDYPGVGDLGRAGLSFADQNIARKVGLLGWARNIPGAATAGSGAHVHALSRFSPGTAGSPQMGGGNGLGGADYGPNPPMIPNIGELLSKFDLSSLPKGVAKVVHNYPEFIEKLISHPMDWAKGLVAGPLEKFQDAYTSPIGTMFAKLPMKLLKGVADKVLDIIPAKRLWDAGGNLIHAGEGAASAVGHSVTGAIDAGLNFAGFSKGGIYNGVMKYDSGGYLPPGLTSVLNLSGQPEPVFTADQFDRFGEGNGESFTYAPTFNASDLTAADVADDLDFTRRKMRRQSRRYGGTR